MGITYADELLPMLGRTVVIEPYVGQTGSGGRSYGPAKTYHAYLDARDTLIRDATGQQVVASGTLYVHPRATDGTILVALAPTPVQWVNARLTLDDGTKPLVRKVDALNDETGTTVMFLVST